MPATGEDFKRPQTVLETWTFFKTPGLIQPFKLPFFTKATKPLAADFEGCVIYISDEAAGQKVQYSTGSAWAALG